MYFTGKIGYDSYVQHDNYEDAVEWIDKQVEYDPDGVAGGDYYIDGTDEPCAEDFTITPCGPLGGKSGLGRVEGKFIGEFDCDDDAVAAARAIMEDESHWPNIWFVSDHGNWSLLSE